MKSGKLTKKRNSNIVLYILLVILSLVFYLRQQYAIVKLQSDISRIYDELTAEEAINKRLKIEFQHYTDPEYLKQYLQKLNFVPISDTDIIVVQ